MALLKFTNVSLAFGVTPLLDGVSWQIERGERVCIIGRNGTGKSSLLRIVKGEQQAAEPASRLGALASRARRVLPSRGAPGA